MTRFSFAVAAWILLPLGPALAEETYKIKLKSDTKGDAVKVAESESTDTKMKIQLPNGQDLDQNVKEGKGVEFTETLLELKDGKPVKLSRKYAKAEKSKEGVKTGIGLEGQTIIIEKKGEKFSFETQDGGKLDEDALDFLDKEFNQAKDFDSDQIEKLLLPKNEIKAGETWKIDAKEALEFFGREVKELEFDAKKSTASGKFAKAYQKAGKQFGVLELRFDLAIKSIEVDGNKVDTAGSKLTMKMNLDVCIDGSLHDGAMTGTVEGKVTAKIPTPDGQIVVMNLDIQSKFEHTMKEVRK